MTVKQFEAWVSDNYKELVKVARIAAGEVGRDLLHTMIESVCDGREALPPFPIEKLTVGRFMKPLKRDLMNADDHNRREAQAMGRFGTSLEVLGEDVFIDTASSRSHHKKGAGAQSSASLVEPEKWTGPMPGTIRWRYQQLRDGRLFDERAVRSLAESMHRASHRYRHMGEHGFSFTEYSQEVAL